MSPNGHEPERLSCEKGGASASLTRCKDPTCRDSPYNAKQDGTSETMPLLGNSSQAFRRSDEGTTVTASAGNRGVAGMDSDSSEVDPPTGGGPPYT